ncbi:glycosyltransferase family 2 protein [Psychroserpens sp. XS_ASV72]|uniref:glycosyltransferase family 2 protein n=1 Tax=Psychroserpens sp. XS_ASV72 TaxID=3241293 RepID=UPI003512417B
MNPYFSVVIPLFNKEKHIKTTLNSVWTQTFQDFEVIVVNDGSTDNSLEIIQSIQEDRLKIYSIENQGVSHARNFGISKVTSDKIVFLDADDIWYPHHLEDLKKLFEAFPSCGLYCKAYKKQMGNLSIPSKYKDISKDSSWQGILSDYFESSLINSIAWTSAVMVPKSTFERVGTFNENYNSGEDTDLWIRIALNFPVAFSNKVSAVHNLSSEQKITHSKLSSRQHLDFDDYQNNAQGNASLKKYLDLNRYALAIQYKLENQLSQANKQYHKIDQNNLGMLHRLIYNLPKSGIYFLMKFRTFLRKFNIDLRLFRG